MNARSQPLRNPAAFARVRSLGRFAECGRFRVSCLAYARRNPGVGQRFGVIASKKNLGDAVRRNRAKRVFRALWRAHAHRLPALCDVSVLIRGAYVQEDFAALSARFAKACDELAAYIAAHPAALADEPALVAPSSASSAGEGSPRPHVR